MGILENLFQPIEKNPVLLPPTLAPSPVPDPPRPQRKPTVRTLHESLIATIRDGAKKDEVLMHLNLGANVGEVNRRQV